MRRIKKELVHKRTEIDWMKSGKRKIKAMKIYAEFLTSLKLDDAS